MTIETDQGAVAALETKDVSSDIGDRLAGKYMDFKLADEEYGLEILKVQEILKLMDITRVPRTQRFIRGVINLRGRVIPVVDLRLKFGMEETEATEQTVIIVVQYEVEGTNVTMGIMVDEVKEVLDIVESDIEDPPSANTIVSNAKHWPVVAVQVALEVKITGGSNDDAIADFWLSMDGVNSTRHNYLNAESPGSGPCHELVARLKTSADGDTAARGGYFYYKGAVTTGAAFGRWEMWTSEYWC